MNIPLPRPFCPVSRTVEPIVYPMCLVMLPSNQWWLGWYLPDLDCAVQIRQLLFEHRVTEDPSRRPELSMQLSQWKQDLACAMYEQLGTNEPGSLWLLMGESATTISHSQVTEFLSVADAEFLPQMIELMEKARTNRGLREALDDYKDYRQWTKRQSHLIQAELPSHAAGTPVITYPSDSATVVTNASAPPEEEIIGKHKSTHQNGRKRGRPPGKTRSFKRQKSPPLSRQNDTIDTPVLQCTTSPSQENSATKFHCQTLAEDHDLGGPSPISKKVLNEREVFSPAIEVPTIIADKTTDVEEVLTFSKEKDNDQAQCHNNEQQQQQLPEPQDEPEPIQEDFDVIAISDELPQLSAEPPNPRLEQDLEFQFEPIPPVDLPGTTVREKLDSCLTALRKENESVVPCRNIVTSRQSIQNFLQAVVDSKGVSGPNQTLPILHVCGAPGSGKTITVEQCSQIVKEDYSETSNEWELPPVFCYVNCSHLRNRSKQEALDITMEYAGTTENNLRRPKNGQGCKKRTVVFILDEIDYLVAVQSKETKSEQYIQTLLEWASSPHYMVGVLGISNSVENHKAARLVELGFPRSNKVVFRTYDDKDLTRIALTKIGSTVIDEKAIEFLAKKVAGGSGDARKFLEILSRSITSAMEEMAESVLNDIHTKPVVKVPHVMKTFKSSTIRHNELVESAPAHEKHILCVSIHLARSIGSRPLSLTRLLWICQQVYDALDLSSISELKSILDRLLDSGLLKWMHVKDNNNNNNIRFDTQLEDVESAVEEVLLKQSFYRHAIEKLDQLKVSQCID